MDIALYASSLDPASMLIRDAVSQHLQTHGQLTRGEHRVEIVVTDEPLIEADPPTGFDLIIFLSKHAARSEANALCVHAIGNFGQAQLGGRDGALVETHPAMLTALYRTLRSMQPTTSLGAYTVSLEAVHHGPYSKTPAIFYELGSSQLQWADAQAARIMADALFAVLAEPLAERTSFFGLGSNHYCAGFEPLTSSYDFAGSCAKHSLADFSEDHARWIAERVDLIVLDENSMGSKNKRRIKGFLEDRGIRFVRRKDL